MKDLFTALRRKGRWAWGSSCRVGKGLVRIAGGLALLMVVLAFTSLPYHAHRRLGIAGGLYTGEAEVIVVLGGSGMPSGPELLRLHYAAQMALEAPEAEVVVVHPEDAGVIGAMVRELVLRGVEPGRIGTIDRGTSTREQALNYTRARPADRLRRVALVTAPENMYRSLLTFRKLGFAHIAGVPAFDHALFNDLTTTRQRTGGRAYVPDVGGSMDLRYDLWNRLKLEITCLREYCAITYYRVQGWI
jgi:uncharacterized SAM-binding protein YcdF (DUF218 family)